MSESNVQRESFYKYLRSNGYYFDKELIENYLLSFAETSIVDEKGNKLPFEKLLEKYSELNADVHITTNIE